MANLNAAYETGTLNTTTHVLTLTGVVDGGQTFSDASAVNGDTYYVTVYESADVSKWELWAATYATAGTLTRTTLVDSHGTITAGTATAVQVFQGPQAEQLYLNGDYLTFTAGYSESADTVSSAGSSQTITLDGKTKLVTLDSATCTISLSTPSGATVANATVCYIQDATGGRAIADPASIKDDADNPVTLNTTASKETWVLYWTPDGGTSYRQSLLWSEE